MLKKSDFLEAAWLPDRLDASNRLLRLVHSTKHIVSSSAFLDGRTPLAARGTETRVISLDSFVAALDGPVPATRWIFHESFCGSTLLARVATIRGRALCLREPQVLVDLAGWRATLQAADLPYYNTVVAAILVKLGQRWSQGEAIVIKPSNWVNSIVHDLWDPGRGDRAVIASIPVEKFLVAVLRGGRERIAYVLRLHASLSQAWPTFGLLVEAALPDDQDTLVKAMRLAAATHWMQDCLLRTRGVGEAAEQGKLRLDFPDFIGDGLGVALRINEHLQLGCSPLELAASVRRNFGRHSKDVSRPAPLNDEARLNEIIRETNDVAIGAGIEFLLRLEDGRREAVAAIRAQLAATRDVLYPHAGRRDGSVRSAENGGYVSGVGAIA